MLNCNASLGLILKDKLDKLWLLWKYKRERERQRIREKTEIEIESTKELQRYVERKHTKKQIEKKANTSMLKRDRERKKNC